MRLPLRLTSLAAGAILLLAPSALLAVLVVGRVGWLDRLDRSVTDALHGFALDHPAWVDAMTWWSLVFHPNTWRVAAVGLVIWLARRRRWPPAWWVAVTMAAGGILGGLLKLLVGRDRPDLLDPVARATGYSFPSGHALNNALGAAVFLIVLLPYTAGRPRARFWLWAAAVAIPLVTGLSRVALGVHWTSDVVAGWLLGVAVALIARRGLPAGRRELSREKVADGDGIGSGNA
ncbi:phosphatase PAP2 family protein [Paractinoplanes rhizophilus]|uniref:Phosphatase PAP2 family protein n=1 Tax=Paractinoplanes rhizophilus TaxID=1416877 RepID=A0ABW2HYC8_9ACTN